MKEELYIKGESVDLGDSEITLNFKSNLLGDISKITASNSYTITLPRTNKNIRLLDFPDVAGHESYMMRDYFNAEYYRNGVKLFDAKAVLISCSEDGFDVVLTWGINDKFISLINDDKSIQEFADEALLWNSESTYDYGLTPDRSYPQNGYIPMNTGIDVDSNRDKIFVHPSASVKVLLEQIEYVYGMTLSFPSDIMEKIERLYIPLVSQKSNPKYNYFSVKFGNYLADFSFEFLQTNSISGAYLFQGSTYQPFSIVISNTSIEWYLSINIKTNQDNEGSFVLVVFSDSEYNKLHEFKIYTDTKGSHSYNGRIPFNISDYDLIRISAYGGGNVIIDKESSNIILKNPNITENIKYGTYYPVGSNLPNIKVVDFIKQICWLFGLFAIKSDMGVSFIPVETIIDNKGNAVDWSKKLVPTGWTAEETSYTFGDFAQKNYFRYEENENAKSADGYMVVQNKTLDHEKDLVKLPYTAGGDNGDMSSVPYFKWNDDGENIDLVDCGDRIMYLHYESGTGEYPKLSFKGLSFNEIILKYYSYYQDHIKSPFVIKDTFRLTEIDLKNLDYTIPVYIERYAAFFAIISIKSQGDYSECELLKLL